MLKKQSLLSNQVH